jgi:multidrug efflux pump subunit AcrB
MVAMERFVKKLPQGIGFDWTGLSYQERQAGAQAAPLYAFSILVIFLCLAALYESWPIPISILLALPLGVIGGVIGSTLRGLPNDVYFQIGLLTTLGLTTKNAILIVQFAKTRVEEGMGLIEATLEGAKLRLRPIIMTSLAFGFGVLPLTLASGAGAGAQKAIGTAVLGGVVTSTFRGMPNDVYFQIGLLTTLGLTTKNAILIVQFAKARVEEGMGLIEATLEGAKLRLRPIVMTSLAFGFGVMPLAFASGAGAGAQKAIGTAVLGGVVTSTFLVTLFAPLFYVVIQKTFGKRQQPQAAQSVEPNQTGSH